MNTLLWAATDCLRIGNGRCVSHLNRSAGAVACGFCFVPIGKDYFQL